MTALQAVDLCCGAGGVSEGYRQAGVEVLAGIDFDPVACKSYRLNHAQAAVYETSLQEITPTRLLRDLGLARRELSILTACVPCQTFSTIGAKNRKPRDPRPRLIERVGDFVSVLRPAFFVMENVPQVRDHYRFALLLRRLRALGYGVRHQVVDMSRYGVPQRRRRLLMIARRGRTRPVPLLESSNRAARRFERTRTVRDTIGSMGPRPGDTLHDTRRAMRSAVVRRLRAIPRDGGSRSSLPYELRLACHEALSTSAATGVYGRMRWDSVGPTMTTRCTTPACGRFGHPAEHRPITLREAAALQTFPLSYQFEGSRGQIERQIGNAVPPRVALVVARVIQDCVDADSPR